jgi:AraC-like DNA-binding protein
MFGRFMPQSPADGTMSVLVFRALVAGATFHGIERERLASESGIPLDALAPERLLDPDGRVPARLVLELWESLPRLTQNEHFGLWLAELSRAAPLTAASWLILSSPSLEAGVRQALRFQRLLHDHAASELVTDDSGAMYVHRIGNGTFRAPRHAIEFGMAQLVFLVRRATGKAVVPARVQLQHARPSDLSLHQPIFGQHIEFGAERDTVSFDRATCALPVVTADPSLGELVMAHARELHARLPENPSWTNRVQRLVSAELPRRMLTIDDVATRLSVPKRTLQRRLKEEGTSFEELTDVMRRELAERYLREQRLGVQETAFLLGYSDVSAFHRAFQRWTGVTPSAWRGTSNDLASRTKPISS